MAKLEGNVCPVDQSLKLFSKKMAYPNHKRLIFWQKEI